MSGAAAGTGRRWERRDRMPNDELPPGVRLLDREDRPGAEAMRGAPV
jgi:hypothetical protein